MPSFYIIKRHLTFATGSVFSRTIEKSDSEQERRYNLFSYLVSAIFSGDTRYLPLAHDWNIHIFSTLRLPVKCWILGN